MRIIISPAKKMKINTDMLPFEDIPYFIEETKVIQKTLQTLSYEEAKNLWKCNDKIATYHYDRLKALDLYHNLTPAILSYEGIQYQYMSPSVFHTQELEYIKEHLRILSGFYGLLKPFDGVVPYRLEMQAKLSIEDKKSLYDYWKDLLAKQLFAESRQIVNLASVEYSKCITKYRKEDVHIVTCVFGEWINNKVVEKGTYAKMARGEMVRFMAEKKIKAVEQIKEFDRLGYLFSEELSDDNTYIFLRVK
ncbi:MAG: peroxide stress protein YaaA [Candidatus Galacturonibacter soehngenii]|nr:peroxide stress protein YaaA [Candidatus Galacturonibacter soehngenii]